MIAARRSGSRFEGHQGTEERVYATSGGLARCPAWWADQSAHPALLYLGEQLASLPFVPFDLFDTLARVLPGGVITAGIDTLVRLITALNALDNP